MCIFVCHSNHVLMILHIHIIFLIRNTNGNLSLITGYVLHWDVLQLPQIQHVLNRMYLSPSGLLALKSSFH